MVWFRRGKRSKNKIMNQGKNGKRLRSMYLKRIGDNSKDTSDKEGMESRERLDCKYDG